MHVAFSVASPLDRGKTGHILLPQPANIPLFSPNTGDECVEDWLTVVVVVVVSSSQVVKLVKWSSGQTGSTMCQ